MGAQRQYLYFCASKASRLSTCVRLVGYELRHRSFDCEPLCDVEEGLFGEEFDAVCAWQACLESEFGESGDAVAVGSG